MLSSDCFERELKSCLQKTPPKSLPGGQVFLYPTIASRYKIQPRHPSLQPCGWYWRVSRATSPPIFCMATPAPPHAAAGAAGNEILSSPPSPSPCLPPLPPQISLERLETEDEFKVITITF